MSSGGGVVLILLLFLLLGVGVYQAEDVVKAT
jgi:hypothetical protein